MPQSFQLSNGRECEDGVMLLATVTGTNDRNVIDMVETIQEVLYDDIGAGGHFRIAPANMDDLTQDVVYGSAEAKLQDPRKENGNNTIDMVFLITKNDPDVTLEEEIEFFNGCIQVFNPESEDFNPDLDIQIVPKQFA